jgi:integrase
LEGLGWQDWGVKYVSVYRRARSPFWWIVYWCPKRQKRISQATPYRWDSIQGKRKALDLANDLGRAASADKGAQGRDRWECWVPDFLELRYPTPARKKTHDRMVGGWNQWRQFLLDQHIAVPRALNYQAVLDFVAWRSSQKKKSSGKVVTKNTALCDVRIMSVVMREAMRRDFCEGNPCDRIGITKDRPKEKFEISDPEIDTIRRALKKRPTWMQVSFEIAIHQGCRLQETSVPWNHVDFARDAISFVAKGRNGQPHEFTTKLHPELKPILQRLRAKNPASTRTCILPVMAAKEWHFFFKEIGLPHLSFHCTRVTVITRLARAGVPIQQAMAFVGHASEAIHQVYQKLKPADAGNAVAAILPGSHPTVPSDSQVSPSSRNEALLELLLADPVVKQRLLSMAVGG